MSVMSTGEQSAVSLAVDDVGEVDSGGWSESVGIQSNAVWMDSVVFVVSLEFDEVDEIESKAMDNVVMPVLWDMADVVFEVVWSFASDHDEVVVVEEAVHDKMVGHETSEEGEEGEPYDT